MAAGVAQIKITGNVTEAIAALDALGIKAELTGKKAEAAFGDSLQSKIAGTGNAFSKLGTALAGLPIVGESFTKMGEKIAEADTKGQKLGATLSAVGQTALMAGAAGLAVVAAESVKMAGDFQSAAEHLVTDAGLSQSALKQVEDGMLAVSAATGTSATDIVNGMYHIQSGLHLGAGGLGVLKVAAEGAKVGNADLDTVSKTLTGTLASYYGATMNAGNATSRATSMMNELIATVGAGDMRMEDLASSLGNVTPIAAAAGLSFAQVGGAIATMTSQNMSAQQATQDLANLIRGLQAPNQVAVNEMAQFGLNANDVSKNLGKQGLTGTLTELVSAITSKMGPGGMVLFNAFNQSQGAAKDMQIELSKMPPSLQTLAKGLESGSVTVKEWRTAVKGLPQDQAAMAAGFLATYNQAHKFNQLLTSGSPAAQTFNAALEKMTGGATGLNTALMLTGDNAGVFQSNVNSVAAAAKKGGDHVDNWAAIQKTFNQQVDQAKVTVEDLGIKLGLALIPKLEDAAHAGMDVVNWLEQHKVAAEVLAGVIAGTLSVAIGAFTVNKIASMVKSVQEAAKTLGDLERTVVRVATTLLTKFGLISESAQASSAEVSAAAASEAAEVEASTTQMGAAVESEMAGMESASASSAGAMAATVESEMAGMAGTVETEVSGMATTVDGEIAATETALSGMVATAGEDAAIVEEDAAAAGTSAGAAGLGKIFAGAAIADVGSNFLPGAHNTPGSVAGIEKTTSQIPLLGGIANNISNSILNALGKGGQAQLSPSQIAGYTVYGPGGVPLADRAPTPTRALGGAAVSGQPYRVGERGPEWFVPDSSGTILPNGTQPAGAGKGDQNIVVNVYGQTDNPYQLSNEIGWQLRPYLSRA